MWSVIRISSKFYKNNYSRSKFINFSQRLENFLTNIPFIPFYYELLIPLDGKEGPIFEPILQKGDIYAWLCFKNTFV